ncbi:MAG: glycosyltransferase [Pseudomonadota bacterium]
MSQRSRLRIGFRVGEFPKLSETFVLDQINHMIAQGHDVQILADRREDVVLASTLRDYADALARTTFLEPQDHIRAQIFQLLPYRVRMQLRAKADAKLCAENDVVVCNFGWFGNDIVKHRSDHRRHAKVVTIFHGADLSRDVRGERDSVYDQLLQDGDLHLAINSRWLNWLKDRGASGDKTVLHYLGVDPDTFKFEPRRTKAPSEPFVFANVCRLVSKKGNDFALKALAELRRLEPHRKFEFRLAGDGPCEDNLKQLTASLGLSDVVTFLGRVPHADIRRELAAADAFLAPSVVADDGDMEGIPIAIMEAMAVGLPVVSTVHSGIPELIQHNVNGRLCAEHDVPGLAALLRKVMTEPDETRRYAVAARRTIETVFNNHLSNERLEHLITAVARGEQIVDAPHLVRQAV